jgi:NAD(P)H-dependent flavin oxidoreductase YrpB (nitropropane dioxygenase family)
MNAQTDTRLLNPFGIELSIIQAPMAAVTTHPIDWDPD